MSLRVPVTHTHTHTHSYLLIHMCAHTYCCMLSIVHTCTHTHEHEHMKTLLCLRWSTHIIHTGVWIHTLSHSQAITHSCTNTHAHTYILTLYQYTPCKLTNFHTNSLFHASSVHTPQTQGPLYLQLYTHSTYIHTHTHRERERGIHTCMYSHAHAFVDCDGSCYQGESDMEMGWCAERERMWGGETCTGFPRLKM